MVVRKGGTGKEGGGGGEGVSTKVIRYSGQVSLKLRGGAGAQVGRSHPSH